MRAPEFIPEVQRVLEERGEPAYRLGQAYAALTGSLVRDWEEATSLPKGLARGAQRGCPGRGTRPAPHLAGDGRDEEVPLLHPRRPRHRDGHDPREGTPHRLHLDPGRLPDGLQVLRDRVARHQAQPEGARDRRAGLRRSPRHCPGADLERRRDGDGRADAQLRRDAARPQGPERPRRVRAGGEAHRGLDERAR